jgi:hypothetical protein
MALRYPWSVLDIPPTADESAIRKAYAAKLRLTRPDEDPKGFQELREARDAALAQSRFLDQEDNDDQASAFELPDATPVEDAGLLSEVAQSLAQGESGATAEVGTVVLVDPHDITAIEPDDDASEVLESLNKVGTPHPWRDLKSQWADVFDAMEADSLANQGYNMWIVLPRLLDDVRQTSGRLPDGADFGSASQSVASKVLGAYAPILQDFERRFGILHQDTILLEYMSEEDARALTSALTIAVGRELPPQPRIRQEINVEAIEEHHVQAAWANDPKMLDYYHKALEKDEFPWSFNFLALLFPLPVALYYRLNGAAAFSAVLVFANAIFAVMIKNGMDAPFAPFASTFYLIVALAIAFNWRRMRMNALSAQIRRLTDANLATAEFGKGLISWSRPNVKGMLLGVAVLIVAVVARISA